MTSVTETVSTIQKTVVPTVAQYGDWRDDLHANGYAIVKGAIPLERAQQYQQRAFKWLSSFSDNFSISDPSTWKAENLPVQTKINTFSAYCLPHEAFMWDVRLEPGVVGAFELLWGTPELLVSFDSVNITLPNRADRPRKGAWPHVDQSPLRRGLCCAQGVVNLSPAGPEDGSLVVFPGSHAVMEEFFDTQTDRGAWEKRDVFLFTDEHLRWFAARGITPQKVLAEPGDLLIWDSRTIHWGAEPSDKSDTIRTVVYASYAPAAWAADDVLAEKAKIFRAWAGTTHWPHDNLIFRDPKAVLDDGTPDPRNRVEPLEKPELTDRLLKLAGARKYDGTDVVPAAWKEGGEGGNVSEYTHTVPAFAK